MLLFAGELWWRFCLLQCVNLFRDSSNDWRHDWFAVREVQIQDVEEHEWKWVPHNKFGKHIFRCKNKQCHHVQHVKTSQRHLALAGKGDGKKVPDADQGERGLGRGTQANNLRLRRGQRHWVHLEKLKNSDVLCVAVWGHMKKLKCLKNRARKLNQQTKLATWANHLSTRQHATR